MKIFNTLTRQKEEFVPLEEGKVKMYVCGPTVYNLIHIGNARPMIIFDTVRRYLEYKGYEVNYVSNFTDVDDKIIKKPGFLHAKSFVCDDEIGVVGTINLDYRSLYLHFEDGVWIYRNKVIGDIKKDFTDTLDYCNPVTLEFCRGRNIAVRAMQSILRLFAPML